MTISTLSMTISTLIMTISTLIGGRRYQNSNYLYRMTTLLAISVLASAVGPEVTMQMLPTVLQVTTPTTRL
jgi:hypothetical protein